jgi:hypothetical protein
MNTKNFPIDAAKPSFEALFALHRVALSSAEALAELNVQGMRTLSRQTAAIACSLPEAGAVAPWLVERSKVLPHQANEALALTRSAYAICATSAADWMGICAGHGDTLCRQSLEAVETLIKTVPGHENAQAANVRQTMESAYRAYQGMLDTFRKAAESMAAADVAALARMARTK